jgi:selenocysteine lyase/cysteine desulfurase
MQLAQKKRLEVRLAKNLSGIVHEEELEKLVDDQTAVVSISHVEYATGQRYDLRWLSELAHSHGALLIVDATQSAGLVPIDVRLDGVDALVASGYKGLLGPFGAAIFYLRREHVRKLAPPLVGWRSTQDPSKLDVRTMSLADSARKFEHSSMSYASAFGLAESIRYLGKTGYRNVTNHVVSLSSRLVDIIKNDHDLPGSTIITPEDESSRAAITSLRFKNKDQSRIVTELARRKIIVAQRLGSIRFSFHVYNTDEDLSRAVQILKEIVTTRQCDRF